jgi:hypothetical protein
VVGGRPYVTEELIEGGTGPSWWHRGWTALPPTLRAVLGAAVVVVLLWVGLGWWRDQAVERGLRQRVVLDPPSIGVWSSSTSPLGGSVNYFVVVGNAGPRPVWIESLAASGPDLRLRLRGDDDRRVPPGEEIAIPLSVRLTCGADPGSATSGLEAELLVRTQDGGSTARRVELGAAGLLRDVAGTVCRARPGLVDRELSGPVLGGG